MTTLFAETNLFTTQPMVNYNCSCDTMYEINSQAMQAIECDSYMMGNTSVHFLNYLGESLSMAYALLYSEYKSLVARSVKTFYLH